MKSAMTALWWGFCVALLSLSAYAGEDSATYDVGLPHPSTNVPYAQALQDAQSIARQNPNWEVARCQGFSMSPFFTERSLLLVKKIPFEKLRPGMVAVYTDSAGDIVAHKVTARAGEGWHCQAFQNKITDPTPVSSANFRGIVFGVLNANSGPDPDQVARMDRQIIAVMGKTYQ